MTRGRRLFKLAVEGESAQTSTGEDATQPSIEMKGPLAEIYRKALDVAFAKKDTVTGEPTVGQENGVTATDAVAVESQANDALTLAHMRSLMVQADSDEVEEDGAPSALLTVYGVSDGDLSEDTVVDVTKQLAAKPPERDFVLILDSTQNDHGNANSGVEERFVRLEQALESMVLAHHGRVYRSLAEFGKTLQKS